MKLKKGALLWNKAKKIIPGGTQLFSKRPELMAPNQWPPYYEKAKGAYVWDIDGKKYLDMYSMGIGSCILGYADFDVNKAVKKAIDKGSATSLNSPEEVELAELLCKIHPWATMVRYARSGGEAMAIAVRVARAYTKKDTVAFCGYHGWSDWYLASNLADDKNLDGHLLPGLEPRGVPRGLKGTALPFSYNKIEELERIAAHHDIGAIVMEPMRYQEPKDDFLFKVQRIAKKIGAVLIFDEVTSGWRFLLGGVHPRYKVFPDMAVFAKGMGNGFPIAAIIGRETIMQAAQKSFISSTNWTERVGFTAALATIRRMKKEKVHSKLWKTGTMLEKGIKELARKHGVKLKFQGLSPLFHFSFEYGDQSMAIRTLFTQEMLKKNILAADGVYIS